MGDQITASFFNQHKVRLLGDKINSDSESEGINIFKIKLIEKDHVEDDPSHPCKSYKVKGEYGDCLANEILTQNLNLINCTPPWMTENEDLWCKGQIYHPTTYSFYHYYNFLEDVTNSESDPGHCLVPCKDKK